MRKIKNLVILGYLIQENSNNFHTVFSTFLYVMVKNFNPEFYKLKLLSAK